MRTGCVRFSPAVTVAYDIKNRFTALCDAFPGSERIDHIALTADQKSSQLKRADFFFEDRTIICELKSLETDTNDKIIPILKAAGVPLAAGTFELTALIRERPDYDQLYRACVNALTTSVQDGLSDANRQIRETKRLFGISDADGLVIFLHGRVAVLNPDIIMNRILERLAKRKDDGSPSHESVSAIVLMSEIHKLKFTDGTMASAAIPVAHEAVPAFFNVMNFSRRLVDAWADWNGRRKHVIPASALRQ